MTNRKKLISEKEVVFQGIKRLYPKDADEIFALCLNENSYPYGYTHPDVLAEISGIKLEEDLIKNLRCGYVMLSGYYFLLDSVIDDHLANRQDALFLTHLLWGADYYFQKVIKEKCPDKLPGYLRIFNHQICKNASSVKLEYDEIYKDPLEYFERDDYECIVGRSYSAIFLYELLCLFSSSNKLEKRIKSLLSDLVYYFQLADDLGDWREDYRNSQWTSFLRRCFIDSGEILGEEDLEEMIYLGGIYEDRLLEVIKGLDKINNGFETIISTSCVRIKVIIEQKKQKLINSLREKIELKLYAKK